MEMRLYTVTPKGKGSTHNIKVSTRNNVMNRIGLYHRETPISSWPEVGDCPGRAPGRPCWLRERAGLWLAGNDIIRSQSQPRSFSPRLWELGMGTEDQYLWLHLAPSLCRPHPVLGTGREGA